MKKNRYFCNCCRKQIKNLENLLFIDDFSLRGFCSEKCILDFYTPYIDSFYDQEASARNLLKIQEEFNLNIEEKNEVFKKIMKNPDEIWQDKNDLGEVFFTYFSFVKNLQAYAIMICCQYEGEVSFIFHKCITKDIKLLEEYKTGQKVNTSKTFSKSDDEIDESIDQDIELPSEILEELDQKKSSYLANLLQFRAEDDIEYDEFMDYESYLPMTLEDPDEVYEMTDDDSDEISTFIKSFQVQRTTFFYVVVCWKCNVKSYNEQMLIPILCFPSKDQTLYQEFAQGERVVGQLKN